jgi:hypothetical protein
MALLTTRMEVFPKMAVVPFLAFRMRWMRATAAGALLVNALGAKALPA